MGRVSGKLRSISIKLTSMQHMHNSFSYLHWRVSEIRLENKKKIIRKTYTRPFYYMRTGDYINLLVGACLYIQSSSHGPIHADHNITKTGSNYDDITTSDELVKRQISRTALRLSIRTELRA